MADSSCLIHVQYATAALEKKWQPLLAKPQLKKWVQSACKSSCELTLRLVNQQEGLALNQQYRGQKHATNILTFALNEPVAKPSTDTIQADLVFCMPVIEKEARLQNKEVLHHMIHLLIHGVLHAQGFDHEDPIEADGMEALEVAILHRLKLKNPYI